MGYEQPKELPLGQQPQLPQQQPEGQEPQLSKQRLEDLERERIMLETARDQVDLAEEKRNSMDAKFAKMHGMHQQQMYHSQQMQSQYEANTRMIMQQMANMQ